MSARLCAQDLRTIADALDSFGEATNHTRVAITSWTDEHITYRDHVIRLDWEPDAGATEGDASQGRYVIVMPDKD